MKIDITRAVKEKRQVEFMCYRDGELWYQTEFGEIFSIPISDTDRAAFLNRDKAILFMRWMRKWNESLEE